MKTLLYFISVLFLLSSCTRMEKAETNRNALNQAYAKRDSIENEMVSTMDEINKNLDLIREKQNIISGSKSGESISKKQEILKTISLINSLLEENKKKIAELNELTKKLGEDKIAMARVAEQTRARIQKQEKEIENLKILLAQEEFKVADLNNKMDEMQVANEVLVSEKTLLEELNKQMDKDMNTAYFTYGTSKELNEKGIVEKKGGFLGIGKKEELATAFVKNRSYFTELDIRDVKTIPLHGVKAKIMSTHPEGSYTLTEGENGYSTLDITDPTQFWSVSKFLVVEVKESE